MTRRIIVTGPPGSGKSAALTLLPGAVPGAVPGVPAGDVEVVREAATDVVATMLGEGLVQPERDPHFLERIVALQRERRLAATAAVQVHDRSVFCTLALARFLDLAEPAVLRAEAEACAGWFGQQVLYVEPLGSIEPTPVRRITYADALRFGDVHREVYAAHGFELVDVPPAPPSVRAGRIALVAAGRPLS